jgi:hypothetical protein
LLPPLIEIRKYQLTGGRSNDTGRSPKTAPCFTWAVLLQLNPKVLSNWPDNFDKVENPKTSNFTPAVAISPMNPKARQENYGSKPAPA